ncbi:hypothetical protein [Kribbella alba]
MRYLPAATRIGTMLAAVAASAVVVTGGGQTASAGCEFYVYYELKATSVAMRWPSIPIFTNGKGGTLSVSKQTNKAVSYGVVAGAESEVGAVLAKAKVSISANLTKTNSSTVINGFSHTIRPAYYGHVKYVSDGKRVSWVKKRQNGNCTYTTIGSGVINFPSISEGWDYWESKSRAV